jgi:pyrroline-5-carboxylate reductase
MVAAANHERHGNGLLRQLFKYYGQNIPVSEKMLKAATAAANKSYSGLESLQHLFDHYGASLPVSEEVIKAVAAEWKQREDAVARLC